MIQTCRKYGHKFNDEVVDDCPQCHPYDGRMYHNEDKIDYEIRRMKNETLRNQRRIIRSERTTSATKWERDHGKQIRREQ